MGKLILIFISILILFGSCKKDDGPREKRFFDKIIIEDAKTTGWDVLSGPDMALTFKDNLIDSLANIKTSETKEDVVILPITFEDVTFELTDLIEFRVIDINDFAPDQIMWQKQINAYARSEDGNPFLLSDSDWEIKVYWKTQ